MFKYLENSVIDYNKWDTCLHKAPNGIIYGLSWYLDIVSPGWHAIVRQENEEYVAVMPIPVAQKFRLKYVRQPIFSQQLGLFYTCPITQKEWEQIGTILFQEFKMISKYSLNIGNGEILSQVHPKLGASILSTYHLDLYQQYDSIKSGYRRDRKSDIKKALNRGFVVKSTENIDILISIFNEYVAPKITGIIGEEYEYKMLRQLYKETRSRGMSCMFAAVDDSNEVQAIGIFFCFNKKVIFMLNSSTPVGKRYGGVSLIIDHVFKLYAGHDLIFDFEAPDVEKLVDFYSSFGSKKVNFLSVSLNDLPAPFKLMKEVRKFLYINLLNKI